jgi:hypothetical protein
LFGDVAHRTFSAVSDDTSTDDATAALHRSGTTSIDCPDEVARSLLGNAVVARKDAWIMS